MNRTPPNLGQHFFIVKRRHRVAKTTQVRKGATSTYRNTVHWSPWKGQQYCRTLPNAADAMKRRADLDDDPAAIFGIFHRGELLHTLKAKGRT